MTARVYVITWDHAGRLHRVTAGTLGAAARAWLTWRDANGIGQVECKGARVKGSHGQRYSIGYNGQVWAPVGSERFGRLVSGIE